MYDAENTEPRQTNYLLLSFVIMQIIFIIAGIATIIDQLNQNSKIDAKDPAKQPHISIEDFSQKITNFPADRQDFVQNSLLNIVQANNPDINLGETKAEIRDSSIYEHYFELPNLNYTSAIIDIPELEQSYQVFLQISDDKYNRYLDPNSTITFLCVINPDDIIYSDFNCTDIYSQKTRNSIVETYLKYFQFNGFTAWISDYEDIVIVPIDFGVVDEENFITQAKAAVSSLGISPNLFNYRIMQEEEYDLRTNR